MTYTTAARLKFQREKPVEIDVPTLEEEEELTERLLELIDQTIIEESEADEDQEDIEEKGVRYVRTPEGARRYGQPIGTPIIADVAGNPLPSRIGVDRPEVSTPAIDEAVSSPWRGDKPDLTWGTPGMFEEARMTFGPYTAAVRKSKETGKFQWVVTTDSHTGWQRNLGDGWAKTLDGAKRAAKKVIEERVREYQDRTHRDYENLFDYYEGVEGYDFWSDGSEVTEEDIMKFDDPEYRYDLAMKTLKEMGISLSSEGHRYYEEPYEFDVNALEMIQATARAYEDMHPGFTEAILGEYGVGTMSTPGALAYNTIGNFDSPNYAQEGMKTKIVLSHQMFGVDMVDYSKIEGVDAFTSSWWSVDYTSLEEQHLDEYHEFQLKMLTVPNHEVGHSFGRVAFGELVKPGYDMKGPRDHFFDGFYDIMYNWGFLGDEEQGDTILSQPTFEESVLAEKHVKAARRPIMNFDAELLSEILSRYGAASFHEMIAESWVEYIMDPNPRQFAVEVGNLLEETMTMFLESKES